MNIKHLLYFLSGLVIFHSNITFAGGQNDGETEDEHIEVIVVTGSSGGVGGGIGTAGLYTGGGNIGGGSGEANGGGPGPIIVIAEPLTREECLKQAERELKTCKRRASTTYGIWSLVCDPLLEEWERTQYAEDYDAWETCDEPGSDSYDTDLAACEYQNTKDKNSCPPT